MKNEKLKRKWLNIQSFSNIFDSKLLKNDPVDQILLFYYGQLRWKIKILKEKSLPALPLSFTDNFMCYTIFYQK